MGISNKIAASSGYGNFTVKALAKGIFRDIKIVIHLQAQPELRGHLEIARQSQRRIGGDAASALDDFIDAPSWNAEGQRQLILTQLHGLQKLLQQDFAGVDRLQLFCLLHR